MNQKKMKEKVSQLTAEHETKIEGEKMCRDKCN
jgi:hypothetical protein